MLTETIPGYADVGKKVELGRIELQAPLSWIAALDAAALAFGVTRSAYIRIACNAQMRADREASPPQKKPSPRKEG